MLAVKLSEMPVMLFEGSGGSKKMSAQSSKIGWLHAKVDKPGTFDVIIKDALGRVKLEKRGIKAEGERCGERLSLPTHLGEELEVSVENISGPQKVNLFIN